MLFDRICKLLSALLVSITIVSCLAAESRHRAVTNIFSTPDAGKDVVPTYTGRRAGQAANPMVNSNDDLPQENQFQNLPSLSEPQRKAVQFLFSESRKQIQPINAKLDATNKRLKELTNKTPDASSTSSLTAVAATVCGDMPNPSSSTPTAEDLKAKIADLKQSRKKIGIDMCRQLNGLLTADQVADLDAMRHGTLLINAENSTHIAKSKQPAGTRKDLAK